MSRRKQANPKYIKVANEKGNNEEDKSALIDQIKSLESAAELKLIKTQQIIMLKDALEKELAVEESHEQDMENEPEKYGSSESKTDDKRIKINEIKKNQVFFKNMTNSQMDSRKHLISVKYSDEDIDVENLSDDNQEESGKSSEVKYENTTESIIVKTEATNPSSPQSPSTNSLSPKTQDTTSNNIFSSENTEASVPENTDINKIEIKVNEKPSKDPQSDSNNCKIYKTYRRNNSEQYSKNEIDQSKQNSILVNGKRYYPLQFSCENCGLRYSDRSTLNTHIKNYCSKRNQPVVSSRSSLSPEMSEQSPISSRSNSPKQEKNQDEIKNQSFDSSQVQYQSNVTNSTQIKNLNENSSSVQLLKSVIYQCSYCLFQTDKKSAINRHSRVHLPQKRKQMEEESSSSSLTKTDSSESLITRDSIKSKSPILSPVSSDVNDKTKSYCKDCDIQFSSLKTYQHHRDNYCQKYKTIESVVSVEATVKDNENESNENRTNFETNNLLIRQKRRSTYNTSLNHDNTHQMGSSQQAPNGEYSKIDHRLALTSSIPMVSSPVATQPVIKPVINQSQLVKPIVQSSHSPVASTSSLISPSIAIPPNALRMGDLVYVPFYKLPTDISHNINGPNGLMNNLKNNEVCKSPAENPLDLTKNVLKNDLIVKSTKNDDSKDNEKPYKRARSSSNESDNESSTKNLPLDLSKKNISNDNKSKLSSDLSAQPPNLLLKPNSYDSALQFNFSSSQNQSLLDLMSNTNTNYSLNQEMIYRALNKSMIDPQMSSPSNEEIKSSNHDPSLRNIALGQYKALANLPYLQSYALAAAAAAASSSSPFSTSFIPYETRKPLSQNPTENAPVNNNKVYRCGSCQEIFQNLKSFKRHPCNSTEEAEIVINPMPNQRIHNNSIGTKEKVSNEIQPANDSKNNTNILPKLIYSDSTESSNTKMTINTEQKCSLTDNQNDEIKPQKNSDTRKIVDLLNADADLLKHPLVQKTLMEIYGTSSLSELNTIEKNFNFNLNTPPSSSRNFFMCTTCGYRGNTARGVKQHGKLHLTNKEHYGIINAHDKQPILVYYSKNDSEIELNGNSNNKKYNSYMILSSNGIDKVNHIVLTNNNESPNKIKSNNEEVGKAKEDCKIPVLLFNESQNNKVDGSNSDIQQPVSKKARLLDSHYQQQQQQQQQQKPKSSSQIDKSQTYCFKCNIQFQQVNNYLAHKNLYCKDE